MLGWLISTAADFESLIGLGAELELDDIGGDAVDDDRGDVDVPEGCDMGAALVLIPRYCTALCHSALDI